MKLKPLPVEKISVDDMLSSVDDTVDMYIGKRDESVNLGKAVNIVEWVIGQEYLAQPQLFEYKRQYQVLRDFFQLRCPLCNPQGKEYVDVWDKGREYLESENLLVWKTRIATSSLRFSSDTTLSANTRLKTATTQSFAELMAGL